MKQTIPVVDIDAYRSGAPGSRDDFVQRLGDALVEYGFVAVENHGVDPQTLAATYQAMESFFALSTQDKEKYELRHLGRQRGYTPFGKERARHTAVSDLKEFWHIGPEFEAGDGGLHRIPSNVWPAELPDFKSSSLKLWDDLHACGVILLEALARYLGAPHRTFTDMVEGGNTVLRMIRYPEPQPSRDPADAVWAAAHEDINLITLLVEASGPGLELRLRDGTWLPIRPIPGQLVMDTGDMMQRLTNGQIPATTHRVCAPQGVGGPRYSLPFFMHPHPDVSLRPLDVCLDPAESPLWPVETAERYLENRLRDNGVLTVDADVDWLAGRTIDDDIE